MATTTYTDDVIIDGSEDEVQLTVQGHSTQTEPLQEWQDSAGTVLAQITEEGRILTGDTGLSTPDALIEAHRDDSSSLPQRGLNTLGRIASALSSPVTWLLSELVLLGTAAISSLHTAVRGRLTHSSTGDSSNAELRAGDFETINQSGSSGTPLGTAVGVQGTVDNQAGAYLTQASGMVAQIQNGSGADIETAAAIEVATPVNDGTIDTLIGLDIPDIDQGTVNYAIRTGEGIVHLGDLLELEQLTADPANKANVVQFYAKSDKIFAKAPDPDNTVYDLTQGGGGGGGLYASIAILRDEKSSGTSGGSASGSSWNARDLNTELYDPDGIVSLSSNQFTPVSGDYELEAYAPNFRVSRNRLRLYNVTAATSVEEGQVHFSGAATGTGVGASNHTPLRCKFTANGTDAYRIDHFTAVAYASVGLGWHANDGSNEVYLVVVLRRLN